MITSYKTLITLSFDHSLESVEHRDSLLSDNYDDAFKQYQYLQDQARADVTDLKGMHFHLILIKEVYEDGMLLDLVTMETCTIYYNDKEVNDND